MEIKTSLIAILSVLVLAGVGTQIYLSASVPSFNPQTAIDIDYYQKVSYCDVDAINSWTCGSNCAYFPHMQDVKAFNNNLTQAQGYCAYDADRNNIVVAFRGSSNTKNWIADFVYYPVSYSECAGCLIHAGFKTTLAAISYGINSCVKSLAKKHPSAQVVVTGHSLGGAVATLSVLEISKFITPSKITFMNFGSPRVGNQAFVDYFMSVIPNGLRVVNYRDIVPHLPLQAMDFKHINYEVWMLYNGAVNNYTVCPIEEDPNCSDSLLIYSVPDHTNYFGFDTGC